MKGNAMCELKALLLSTIDLNKINSIEPKFSSCDTCCFVLLLYYLKYYCNDKTNFIDNCLTTLMNSSKK